PGQVSKLYLDPVFTRMVLKASFDEEELNRYWAFFRATFAGYYKQNIRRGKDGALEGYSFFVGESTAFEYSRRLVKDGSSVLIDKLGVVNVLGTTLDTVFYHKGLVIRARVDVSGDFAMVTSFALERYKRARPDSSLKSVLDSFKYYYAFGVTIV